MLSDILQAQLYMKLVEKYDKYQDFSSMEVIICLSVCKGFDSSQPTVIQQKYTEYR